MGAKIVCCKLEMQVEKRGDVAIQVRATEGSAGVGQHYGHLAGPALRFKKLM